MTGLSAARRQAMSADLERNLRRMLAESAAMLAEAEARCDAGQIRDIRKAMSDIRKLAAKKGYTIEG